MYCALSVHFHFPQTCFPDESQLCSPVFPIFLITPLCIYCLCFSLSFVSVHLLHLCPLVSMLSSFGSFSFYFVIFLGFILWTQASINSSPFVKCTLPSPILHEHICIYVNMLYLISVSWCFLCILALVPVPCCPYVPLTLYHPSSVAGSFCIYRDDDETEDTNTFAGS